MKGKLRYVGLLAILPLFTVALSIDYIGEANAVNTSSWDAIGGQHGSKTKDAMESKIRIHEGNGGKRFGQYTAHIVCGDKLCSEIEAKQVTEITLERDLGVAYIEQFGLSALGEDMYKVVFTVYAGNEDLTSGILHVSSDIANKEVPMTKVFAHSYTYVPVLIQADDPSTIIAAFED